MTDKSVLDRVGLDPDKAQKMVADALVGADDGEMYLQFAQQPTTVKRFDRRRGESANPEGQLLQG